MGKTNFEFMRERLLSRAGLLWADKPKPKFTFESLTRTEWSAEFETYMRNRLIMGALRYGLLSAPGKPQYDRMASARKRMEKYEQTGNTELLVDVANMMLLEFVEGVHPNKHFHAVDGDDRQQTPVKLV